MLNSWSNSDSVFGVIVFGSTLNSYYQGQEAKYSEGQYTVLLYIFVICKKVILQCYYSLYKFFVLLTQIFLNKELVRQLYKEF